jgi:vacuolar-type H+-ATPase subunit I/STV1
MLKKRPLAFGLIVLSIALLLASVFATFLDQHLDGFGDLNDVHAIPIVFQILLLIIYTFLSVLLFFIANNRLVALGTIVLFLFAFVCSYSFTISASTNSITTKVGPFTITELALSDKLSIENKWYGYLVSDQTDNNYSAYLLSHITPLVFYSENIDITIAGLGDCIEYKDQHCVKRSIAWP